MKICAAIPARLKSTRVPTKLSIKINGKTIIQRTVDRVLKSDIKDVYLFTDSHSLICNGCHNIVNAGQVTENGTERISKNIDAIPHKYSHVLIVLGDQPLLNPNHVDYLIRHFGISEDILTLVAPCHDVEDRSLAKVVLDKWGKIRHISRQPIGFYHHVSLVLIKRDILKNYSAMEKTRVQTLENNEWIRFLHNGHEMQTFLIDAPERDLNTPDDLKYIRKKLKKVEMVECS